MKYVRIAVVKNFLGFCMVGVVLFVLGGCSEPPNREELELLKRDDPTFQTLVTIKDDTEAQIAALKGELGRYKAALDQKVGELKASYAKEEARLTADMRVLKAKIETNCSGVKAELSETQAQLTARKNELSNLKGALKELGEVLEKKGTLSLSAEESEGWESKRRDLDAKIQNLTSEITQLETEARIRRKKLKYL